MLTLSFKKIVVLIFCGLALWIIFAFQKKYTTSPEKLSEWGLFEGPMALQKPKQGLVPYALNSPLFSDYAEKLRFVKLPDGGQVPYQTDSVLKFPVGTILVKTFYYPQDFRNKSTNWQLIETRLLLHEPTGWGARSYVWNQEQTEAFLEVAGDEKTVKFINEDGKKVEFQYLIPNQNQCKSCHNKNEKLQPIGPTVAQLNGPIEYPQGLENQLVFWHKNKMLDTLPALENCPKMPVWNDEKSGTIEARAKAYLDINCAHCHNPAGPAGTSGLFLSYGEQQATARGLLKSPVAAGRGSGGHSFDIVPGKPDKSILYYRMASTDPGIAMPEVGRQLVHKEGLALVKAYIKNLP